MQYKLNIICLRGLYWIVGDPDAGPMGPYGTAAGAEEDRRGVLRFFLHEDDLEFIDGTAALST